MTKIVICVKVKLKVSGESKLAEYHAQKSSNLHPGARFPRILIFSYTSWNNETSYMDIIQDNFMCFLWLCLPRQTWERQLFSESGLRSRHGVGIFNRRWYVCCQEPINILSCWQCYHWDRSLSKVVKTNWCGKRLYNLTWHNWYRFSVTNNFWHPFGFVPGIWTLSHSRYSSNSDRIGQGA